MSKNNNHAGMHYQRWWGSRGAFDDGREVDREIMYKRILHQKNESQIIRNISNNNLKKVEIEEENIIDPYHFLTGSYITSNIFMIAMSKNIDINPILDECENKLKTDHIVEKMNYILNKDEFGFPKIEKLAIYLSILAEKLNCNIADFFIFDAEKKKRFVYKLLEDIPCDLFDIYFAEDDMINEDVQEFFLFNYNAPKNYLRVSSYNDRYMLRIQKSDNYYSLAYGDLSINYDTAKQHIMHGVYLWEEKDGLLSNYMEELLELRYPEYKRKC